MVSTTKTNGKTGTAKRYDYDFKKAVLNWAGTHGLTEASKKYNVQPTTIRFWKKTVTTPTMKSGRTVNQSIDTIVENLTTTTAEPLDAAWRRGYKEGLLEGLLALRSKTTTDNHVR